jgi:hypothetical protein
MWARPIFGPLRHPRVTDSCGWVYQTIPHHARGDSDMYRREDSRPMARHLERYQAWINQFFTRSWNRRCSPFSRLFLSDPSAPRVLLARSGPPRPSWCRRSSKPIPRHRLIMTQHRLSTSILRRLSRNIQYHLNPAPNSHEIPQECDRVGRVLEHFAPSLEAVTSRRVRLCALCELCGRIALIGLIRRAVPPGCCVLQV